MCHLFIVDRSFVRSFVVCLMSVSVSRICFALLQSDVRVWAIKFQRATYPRNKSHHSHQHRQIQAHHSVQKGLKGELGAQELFPISHIDIFFLCAMSGRSQPNGCILSKRKVDSETKIYTYLLSLNDEVWGACERIRRMLQLATDDITIFMHYTENLHSLRLGFKTFYKRNTVKTKLARKSRKRQKLWFDVAANKSMQNHVRLPFVCVIEATKCMHLVNDVQIIWIVWKGWASVVHFRLKLASADLVINGDFSRVFMHIMRLLLSGPQWTIPNQAVKS